MHYLQRNILTALRAETDRQFLQQQPAVIGDDGAAVLDRPPRKRGDGNPGPETAMVLVAATARVGSRDTAEGTRLARDPDWQPLMGTSQWKALRSVGQLAGL